MSDRFEEFPAPKTAPAAAVPVLPYAKPDAKVSWFLLGALAAVAVMNIVLAVFALLIAFQQAEIRIDANFAETAIVGILLFLIGVLLWNYTEWSWRRAYELLVISALLCSALSLMCVLRLWRERGGLVNDATMFIVFVGGAYGGLNLAGAYILCRAKRAFGAGHVDLLWRERFASLFPIPLLIAVAGGIVLYRYYA